MEETGFKILYKGFVEWQKKEKGFAACATESDIRQWEEWKKKVADMWEASRIEDNHLQNTGSQRESFNNR